MGGCRDFANSFCFIRQAAAPNCCYLLKLYIVSRFRDSFVLLISYVIRIIYITLLI